MKKEVFLLTFLVFIALLMVLFISGGLLLPDFLVKVIGMTMPKLTFNFYHPPILNYGSEPHVGVHFFMLSGLTALMVWGLIFAYRKFKHDRRPGFQELLQTALVLVIIFVLIRGSFQVIAMYKIKQQYLTGTSYEQNLMTDYGVVYQFASEIQDVLPVESKAFFVTGYDRTRDMQARMQLSYFLYPKVDIRNVHHGEVNAFLAFNRPNAADAVPDGFRIVKQLDARTLIAIREQ